MYKKNQVGVIATIDPNAQDFPGAYQGIPTSTIITVEKCPSGWFLIDCKRTYCCRASQRVQLTLTPDHEEAIINYVTAFKNWKGYYVKNYLETTWHYHKFVIVSIIKGFTYAKKIRSLFQKIR